MKILLRLILVYISILSVIVIILSYNILHYNNIVLDNNWSNTEIKKSCEEVIKELKIKNNCKEVKKIIEEFNYDEIFVATIMHESRFDRNAINHKTKDYGIFQLNKDIWGKTNGDIDYSIKKAKQCLKENGMDCWISYRTGAYKKYYLDAKTLIYVIKMEENNIK